METLYLPVPEDFNFGECLSFLGRSSRECLHHVEEGRIRKLLKPGGKPIPAEITCEPGKLCIHLPGKTTPAVKAAVMDYVACWFDLHTDLAPFYRMAEQDSILAPLAGKYRGLRMITIPDLFEGLCWAITGQQINLAFAYTLKKRLVETYGESLETEAGRLYLHPSPESIASARPEDVQALQYTRSKTVYLIETARAFSEGRISTQRLQALSCAEARDELLKLKGIGRWTADYVLMKCLRHPDAFPAADVGLQNAVREQLGLPQKPSEKELAELADAWKGWKSYAAFYLWRSLLKAG
jgi:DNA-3-methyladenine glycosylase II